MRKFWRHLFMFCCLVASLAAASNAFAASATLRLNRDSLMAGEVTRLQIAVEGAVPQQAATFPVFAGLQITYAGIGQELISQNGQNTQRYILNYHVGASRQGTFQIPKLEVRTDRGTLSVEPFSITVIENAFVGKPAFLKLIVPRKKIYAGELFPVEMILYVTQADDINAPQLKSDGFVTGKQLPHTKGQSQIGNQLYNTFTFKFTMAAAKAGELTLGPAETRLTLLVPSANQDFFMNRFERRPTDVKSDSLKLNVLPLPVAGKPESFSGAIGRFAITREANPSSLSAGDPVTLKYAVKGEGSIETLALPKQNWRDLKVYDPTSNFAPSDPAGLKGIKTFEQVVIPEHSEIREIPPVEFSYFDPQARQYEVIKLEAIPLRVKPSLTASSPRSAGGAGTNGPAAASPEGPRDIVHIKNDLGELLASAYWFQKPWVWGLQLAPVLAFLAVFSWRKREDRLAHNPALRRQLELRREFQTDLHDLRKLDAGSEPEQFFTLAFRTLQTWLALKSGLTPGGITESAVEDLAARGLPLDQADQLRHIFQICNQARYAPASQGSQGAPLLAALENLAKDHDPIAAAK